MDRAGELQALSKALDREMSALMKRQRNVPDKHKVKRLAQFKVDVATYRAMIGDGGKDPSLADPRVFEGVIRLLTDRFKDLS